MNNNRAPLDRGLMGRWVLFSTLGYGIGGIVGWAIATSVWLFSSAYSSDSAVPFILSMAGGGAIAGISIGLAQWRAIRLKAPHASKLAWIGENVAGMAIGWTAFFWVLFIFGKGETIVLALLVSGGLWGFLAGAIQWHILQGQIQRASIWFALNGLIGIVVFGIGWAWIPWLFFDYLSWMGSETYGIPIFGTMFSLISWPLAGVLAGVTTGRLLIGLQRPPKPEG